MFEYIFKPKQGLRLMVSCMKNTCEVIWTKVCLESKFFFIENFLLILSLLNFSCDWGILHISNLNFH